MKVSKSKASDNREAILTAASTQIRGRGLDQTSVADVARAAGLTHGALYSHFQSKDALTAEAWVVAQRADPTGQILTVHGKSGLSIHQWGGLWNTSWMRGDQHEFVRGSQVAPGVRVHLAHRKRGSPPAPPDPARVGGMPGHASCTTEVTEVDVMACVRGKADGEGRIAEALHRVVDDLGEIGVQVAAYHGSELIVDVTAQQADGRRVERRLVLEKQSETGTARNGPSENDSRRR